MEHSFIKPLQIPLYIALVIFIMCYIPDVLGKWIIGLIVMFVVLIIFAIITYWILENLQILIQYMFVEY